MQIDRIGFRPTSTTPEDHHENVYMNDAAFLDDVLWHYCDFEDERS